MARIKMNLNEIPDAPESIEPGKYALKLIECEEKESSRGAPMLEWQWEVADGEFKGRSIKSWTSLQDHALFGLKSHLSAFGLDGEVDFDTDKLIGKRVMATVGKSKIKSRETGEDIEVSRIIELKPLKKGGSGGGASISSRPKNNNDEDDDFPY